MVVFVVPYRDSRRPPIRIIDSFLVLCRIIGKVFVYPLNGFVRSFVRSLVRWLAGGEWVEFRTLLGQQIVVGHEQIVPDEWNRRENRCSPDSRPHSEGIEESGGSIIEKKLPDIREFIVSRLS